VESDLDMSQLETVTRVLKARMAKAACLHLSRVDARTAITLQVAGVYKKDVAADVFPAHVLEVARNTTHPLRVSGIPGPFIFYKAADAPKQQYALHMASVLLSSDVDARLAAVSHFEALASHEPQKLAPRTIRVLNEGKAEIVDLDIERWQSAALELYDAVQDDLLCQLSAAGQALEQNFEDGLREYILKVLCPALSSLEALELKLIKPSEQQSDIAKEICECANQDTLEAACDQYLRNVGYLPLGTDYSLTRVVQTWRLSHDGPADIWASLWHWADSTRSPLARYHVCTIFLEKSEWRAQGQERTLWQEIIEIVSNSSTADAGLHWRDEWSVRRELAQHYLRFLESRAPGAMAEPLASFAWWLTERVAELAGCNTEIFNNVFNAAIVSEAQNSDYAWRLSLPRTLPSVLAITTHLGASTWALSTLLRVTDSILLELNPGMDDEIAVQFEESLATLTMVGFPIRTDRSVNSVYAFESTLSELFESWCAYREGSADAKLASEIASMHVKLSNPSELVSSLQNIFEEHENNQMVVAHWAKSLALQGVLPRDAVWKYLSDPAWRKATFSKVLEPALDELFLAFSLALERNNAVWNAELSHVYASACEEIEEPDRRGILFAFTALSGIHTYSVSALQRLLASNQRAEYMVLLSQLRNTLLNMQNSSPWLTARIRAVLAVTPAA
jgi:hypothetical protein